MHKIGTLLLENFCFPLQLILALRVIASFGHVCARDSVRKPGDENKAVHVSCYTWNSFVRLILGHSVILCQWHRHLQQIVQIWRPEDENDQSLLHPRKKWVDHVPRVPVYFDHLIVRKSKLIEPGGGSVCSLCESTFKSNVKMITNARFLSSYSKDEIEKHEKQSHGRRMTNKQF